MNNLSGKADCIYQKFKNTSTGFKNILQKFDGDFPVSHLTFEINNNLPTGNYGVTSPPNNFNTVIQMSNTQLGTVSDLGGAVAFIHELIHAEIYRKMLSSAQKGDLLVGNFTQQEQIDYANSLRQDFPGIYDYYYERWHSTWNHNLMAEHYRGVISDAIEEFDEGRLSKQIYDDIAWVGLRELEDMNDSAAWNALSSTEKNRIQKNIVDYFKNGTSNCR